MAAVHWSKKTDELLRHIARGVPPGLRVELGEPHRLGSVIASKVRQLPGDLPNALV